MLGSRISNSIPRYSPKGNENICPQKVLYTNVHSSLSHNSQKLETTQMRVKRRKIVLFSYSGILFSNKGITDTKKKTLKTLFRDNRQTHLFEYICIKSKNSNIYNERKQGWGWREWKLGTSQVMKIVSVLLWIMISETHQLNTQKPLHFTAGKLYFSKK